MKFNLKEHTIFKIVHGSHAYGMATPESDIDYKGIAIAPLEYYFGFLDKFEQAEKYVNKGHDYDEVIYDLKKFMYLAANANPNILEMLFVDESDILFKNKIADILLKNRDLFISAKAKFTYSGYAFAQLNRIKNHKRWLMQPPKRKPTREEFGLPENKKLITNSEIGAYENLASDNYEFSDSVMVALSKEKKYQIALKEWQQYQQWEKNRNPKRAELEKKFGYDCKHAAHLVRLMRTGLEILSGKGIIVKRPDAKELLEIRKGAWTYDEIIYFAEGFEEKCNKLYEEIKNSKNPIIPIKPPVKKINEFTVNLIKEFHKI